MRQSFKSILRFLFPELQIIDAVKQDGFIAKKSSVKNMHMANNAVAGNAVVQQNTGMPTAQPSFSKATRASAPKASTVSSSVSVSADKVDDKFEGIEQQLRKTWIASNNNIFALCQAFKRPFVVGTDATMPKNSILLIGNESRGKTKAITDICAVLKQKRLLRYAEVPVVGFERYPTNSEDDLFLSDIYKALYSQSDVIVFENIEKANFRCLDIVFQLIKTGTYRLHKRYVLQNSMLVESTGMLNTASISELNANGKYFVFTSTKSAEKVTEYVGNEFARLINDIIVLDEFSQTDIM